MKCSYVVVALCAAGASAFLAPAPLAAPSALGAKKTGFGTNKFTEKKVKSPAKVERERAAGAYEAAKKSGIPEYRVYVKPGGTEDWAPVGYVTVPRSESVPQSIYGNLESLKSATLAAYPGLKEEQDNLDFGYNLAVFPDDPVKLAKPEEAAATTNPFLKFAKDLTNPMNANAGK